MKHPNSLLLTAFFCFLIILTSTPVNAQDSTLSDSSSTGRIILRYKTEAPLLFQHSLENSQAVKKLEDLYSQKTIVLQVPQGLEDRYARILSKQFFVEYAEPDIQAQALGYPNDTYLNSQWAHPKINSSAAWDVSQGNNTDIAILDTGINPNHPDLKSKITSWNNFTYSSSPYDRYGHGTAVAGVAAASTNNNQGIAGTGYNARLLSVKVLDDRGRGYYSWIINGIYWAADNGAEVINLSLGGTADSYSLKQAIKYATQKGVLVVSAAGNSSSTRPYYPAYYDDVMAVAATDQNDQKASFSNYGSWVDIAAPGVLIFTTHSSNDYQAWSGTSLATPHVAGVAALLQSNQPHLDPARIKQTLLTHADHITGTGSYWASGRLNAGAIFTTIQPSPNPTPSPTPTPIPTTPSPTPTPTPSPLATPSPTSTPEPATPTPSPSPTPTPLPTPKPTPTPPPTPSPSPNSELPWWCKYIPDHHTCQ